MPELDGPKMPNGADYLVRWFYELSVSRNITAGGPSSIPHSEVTAWQELTGNRLTPWEYRVIREIDNLYINSYYGSRRITD